MKVIGIIVVALILIGVAYYFVFRNNTTPVGYLPHANFPLCTTYDNKAGHIINGVCKPIDITPGTINCGGLFNPC